MTIGQIDYLNLLPFTLFIKRQSDNKLFKIMQHHRGYPTDINHMFATNKIKAGFISSIVSKKHTRLKMGIVAHKKILSVLVCQGDSEDDKESKSSNILAKILDQKGKVVIGDKALSVYFENKINFIDLSTLWYEKYNLPFVFAVFCIRENKKFYDKLSHNFLKQNIKIPQYILSKYSKYTNISKQNILIYLSLIHYKISMREERALKKFFRLEKDL